jgi:AcrR family transcriptional regulator
MNNTRDDESTSPTEATAEWPIGARDEPTGGVSADSSLAPGLRRVPQQDRGQRRIDRILCAAAEVIGAVGVDNATTNAIAARAETSVGSLYQFFPNKEAVVRALAARYVAQLRSIMEGSTPRDAWRLPLADLVENVVSPLARFHEENPAYRHVYLATLEPEGPWCGERELNAAVHARIAEIVGTRNQSLTAEDLDACATVCQGLVHSLLFRAATLPPERRPRLIAELKKVMVSYATLYEPASGPGASTARPISPTRAGGDALSSNEVR